MLLFSVKLSKFKVSCSTRVPNSLNKGLKGIKKCIQYHQHYKQPLHIDVEELQYHKTIGVEEIKFFSIIVSVFLASCMT